MREGGRGRGEGREGNIGRRWIGRKRRGGGGKEGEREGETERSRRRSGGGEGPASSNHSEEILGQLPPADSGGFVLFVCFLVLLFVCVMGVTLTHHTLLEWTDPQGAATGQGRRRYKCGVMMTGDISRLKGSCELICTG